MRTMEVKVFKFEELSDEAKKKVLENLRQTNVDYDAWYDSTVEHWKEKLAEQGFNNAEIYFSGFCSQGDGACFDATIDAIKAAKAMHVNKKVGKKSIPVPVFNEMELRILELCDPHYKIETINYHYSHANTRRIEFTECYNNPDNWDEFQKIIDTPVGELPTLIGSFEEESSDRLLEERMRSGLEVTADLLTSLEKSLEEARYRLSNEIYRDLEADYDYQTSDKAVIETIENNDWEFDEDGEKI